MFLRRNILSKSIILHNILICGLLCFQYYETEDNIFSKSLAIKNIKVILEKTTITKKIFVKNKLLNIVTNEK